MTLPYAITYRMKSGRFAHLLICSDITKTAWSVLIDEDEYQSYDTLESIFYDIPGIGKDFIKHVYTLPQ